MRSDNEVSFKAAADRGDEGDDADSESHINANFRISPGFVGQRDILEKGRIGKFQVVKLNMVVLFRTGGVFLLMRM
jgi:hypothetical protein